MPGEDEEEEDFLAWHSAQMEPLPPALHPVLHRTLIHGAALATEDFRLAIGEADALGQRRFVTAARDLAAGSDVWVVRHLFTCDTAQHVFALLQTDPQLLNRVAQICEMDLADPSQPSSHSGHGEDHTAPRQPLEYVRHHLHRYVFECSAGEVAASPSPSAGRCRYLMAELGSHLRPRRAANARVMPFWWRRDRRRRELCSVLWLTHDVAAGEEVTRPPLPLGLPHYGSQVYWEAAYHLDGTPFEWYCSVQALVKAVMSHRPVAPPTEPPEKPPSVLVPGCGNSRLGYELWCVGYRPVVNVDYVLSVITAMKQQYLATDQAEVEADEGLAAIELVPPDGGLEFHVGNVCELRQFPDGAFDLVVDKAMLDALLIAPPGADADWVETEAEHGRAYAYLREMRRLLAPGGRLCIVSLRGHERFQGLLRGAAAGDPEAALELVAHENLPSHLYICRACP
eukprot:EG_transcript_11227